MEEKSKFNVVAFFFLCHIIFFEKPFLSIRIHFFYWLLNLTLCIWANTLLMRWQIEQSHNVTMASFYKTKNDIVTT